MSDLLTTNTLTLGYKQEQQCASYIYNNNPAVRLRLYSAHEFAVSSRAMQVLKTIYRECRMAALPTCQQVRLLDTTDEKVDIYDTVRLPLGITDCLRLLEICSTDPQRISCRLSVASIHKFYIDLSYNWSDPTETYDISVNGRPFRVGRHLLDFLHQALTDQADKGVIQRFWIDALYINQVENLEKNHQVGIMGQIYASASLVLVWLGANHVSVQRALQCSEAMMQHSYSSQGLRRDDLEHLTFHPYWSRAWIRQEFFMASEIDIQCGPMRVSVAVLERLKREHLKALQEGTQAFHD